MSDGIKRREFLKVLGVSGAGAGLAGCSTEGAERLLPYVTAPEEITPGVSTWYATTCGECSASCGLWIRTREGRVVKVEGNPEHPVSHGGVCSRGHAQLNGLYNPDRFTGPMVRRNGALEPITWEEAEQLLADRLGAATNAVFVTAPAGPSMSRLVESFSAAAGADVVHYDGMSDAPLAEACRMAFGRAEIPTYDLENVDHIVSFGADFLETWGNHVAYTRQFAHSSGVDHGEKAHFTFVGPRLSLTGMNADEWLPIVPGSEGLVALAMANVIVAAGGDAGPYAQIVSAYTPQSVAQATGVSADAIQEAAERFTDGKSVALGPGAAGHHRNATATNLAALILNQVAGNIGTTVAFRAAPGDAAPAFADLAGAMDRMASGGVDVALVHGCNPVYSTPTAADFSGAFANVGFKVAFASEPDETTAMADLVLPDTHPLESWGDAQPRNDVLALQQPAMRTVPGFDAKDSGDVLLSVASRMGQDLGATTFAEYVRGAWAEVHGTMSSGMEFDAWWKDALKTGFVETGASTPTIALRNADRALVFDVPNFDGAATDPILMVYPSARFVDGGTNTNSPWLQELPDPVAKITWSSWLEVNPNTAEAMGLRNGDVVTVSSTHGSVDVPVWLYPGVREDVVAMATGGGHTETGRYSAGFGVNAMNLLPADTEAVSGSALLLASRVSLTPTGERKKFATNEGSSTQEDRGVAPAIALAELGHFEEEGYDGYGPFRELQAVGGFVPVETEHDPAAFPLEGAQYGEYDPAENPRWAMAIDLDKCTGCSACITACQSENNVPWVGEMQVAMGRDMHWIRLERYYETIDASHAGHVDVRFLPMLCQHCGNAPCEPVCPVYATYHSPDGVNQQVYNRCVGTRYCANNCPYKVRVYNWYRYTQEIPEPMNLQFNPDVTVRDNGVMEKCSFCNHRIRDANHLAKLENRELRDGDLVTACQQSCPADAIIVGDARDPNSALSQKIQDERTYRVLDALINTQPGVSYLKKVTFHEVEGGH